MGRLPLSGTINDVHNIIFNNFIKYVTIKGSGKNV